MNLDIKRVNCWRVEKVSPAVLAEKKSCFTPGTVIRLTSYWAEGNNLFTWGGKFSKTALNRKKAVSGYNCFT